jgi:hypothetical protein
MTKLNIKESGSSTKKDYVSDATNRLVKGSNETGEEIEYFYNGLGYRIKTMEQKENPNLAHANNENSNANHKDINLEGLIPEGMRLYENEYGLIRANDGKIETDYVVDYLSPKNNDLMAYKKNGFVTRTIYGNDRISQRVYENKEGRFYRRQLGKCN